MNKEPEVIYNYGVTTALPAGLRCIYVPNGEAREYAQLALNPYLGCTHKCTYCYCPRQLHISREDFFAPPFPREGFLTNLAKDCEKLAPFAADLPPVHISFIGDPFQPAEQTFRQTHKAIKMLKAAGLCVQLLTKAAYVAAETMALLDERDWFGVTLTSGDGTFGSDEEPHAGRPIDRRGLLSEAQGRHINTWVSFEPMLYLDNIERTVELTYDWVSHYKFGPLNYGNRGYELADAAKEVRRVMALYGYKEGAMEPGRKTFYLKKSLRDAEVKE